MQSFLIFERSYINFMQVVTGAIVEGRITKITNFGAFVQLPDGKTGLVHISEVSNDFVRSINDHYSEGDTVNVKVLGSDASGRISLSIKKATSNPKTGSGFSSQKSNPSSTLSFEEMLNKFKAASDDKFKDINRNRESKRGSGSYRNTSSCN